MPEQALGGIPLGFGIVVEDKPSELSCNYSINIGKENYILVSLQILVVIR